MSLLRNYEKRKKSEPWNLRLISICSFKIFVKIDTTRSVIMIINETGHPFISTKCLHGLGFISCLASAI